MSVVAVTFDPTRDRSYERAKLARDVADWLAWLELGGTAARTLDQYERDLARGCLLFPDLSIGEWTDSELLHVMRRFKPAERRVRMAAWRSFFRWARQTKRIRENPMETVPSIGVNQTPVRVGQVWADNDWRSRGRKVMVMEVRDGFAFCSVAWPGHETRKRTRISLQRFRPNSTGYRLIADSPEQAA